MAIASKTAEELRKIILGIRRQEIFTDKHLEDKRLLFSVFMPMALFTEAQYQTFLAEQPGTIYAYCCDALEMGINGMPIFPNFHVLNHADTDFVCNAVHVLEATEAEALAQYEIEQVSTCKTCGMQESCELAFDPYNTDGACLAMK